MAKIPNRVLQIARGVKNGERRRRFRVRAVLKWFGASRRGRAIITEVQAVLADAGLGTEPALTDVDIDDQVRFVSLSHSVPTNAGDELETDLAVDETEDTVTLSSNANGHLESDSSQNIDERETEQEDEIPRSKPDDRPVTISSTGNTDTADLLRQSCRGAAGSNRWSAAPAYAR